MHHLTVAGIVSYDLIHVTSVGTESMHGELYSEHNSVPHGVRGAEQPPISAATSSSAGVLE